MSLEIYEQKIAETEEMSTNPFHEGVISSFRVLCIFTFAAHKLKVEIRKQNKCVEEMAWKGAFYLRTLMYFVHF